MTVGAAGMLDGVWSLVVEVIVKMGYGGSRQDAGKAIGKSGDGGIDGMIKEGKAEDD